MRDDYEAATEEKLKEHQVRQVMREEVGLRYRRIVRLAPQANSRRCLIQRQQCALTFLQLCRSKRRWIALDESWLDSVRYQRRCWQRRGGGPGEKQIGISPRLILVAGVDNFGASFFTLLQANSDSETMEVFLTELVKMLD